MYRKFPLFKQDIRYVFGRWKSPEGLEILENKIIPPPQKKIPNRAYIYIQYLYVEQADAYTDIDAPPPLP